ncbi:MAG: DNA recombination protein RmuC [Actinomycetes bacterium]
MDMTSLITGLFVGAALGGLIAWLLAGRNQTSSELDQGSLDALRLALREETAASQKEAFAELVRTNDESRKTSLELQRKQAESDKEAVKHLVTPVKETLEKVSLKIEELEKERSRDSGRIGKHLEEIAKANSEVSKETRALAGALRKPEGRGRWGELQLRRVVELAGMTDYCEDFTEQESVRSDDGILRPDMIVRMVGGRSCVIDSKAPLKHLLDAYETGDADVRAEMMRKHAASLRTHLTDLSRKAYWEQFPEAPDLVLMFLPGEHFLQAALEVDPSLMEDAISDKVIIATPATLVTLLKAIHYGWRNETVAANAAQIASLGKDLHSRLSVVIGHLNRVSAQFTTTITTFNKLVGSIDQKLVPGARKMSDLDPGMGDVEEVQMIESQPRISRSHSVPEPDAPAELGSGDGDGDGEAVSDPA